MQEFVDRAEDLLAALLAREALPNHGICTRCDGHKQAIWRCKDCTLSPLLCRSCMRHSHFHNPLHRIQSWTGSFFRSAWLWEVGVYVLVQHRTEEVPCESLSWQRDILEGLQLSKDVDEQRRLSKSQTAPTAPHAGSFVATPNLWSLNNTSQDLFGMDEEEYEEEVDDAFLNSIHSYLDGADADADTNAPAPQGPNAEHLSPQTPRQDSLNNQYVRVVHVNGVHHIALVTCACHGAEAVHADLIYSRFVPATFSQYKTLFTVEVLDDFRISNLECKASAYQYFQKLRRLTFPTAPARTPNLYQELLRMARVWRWLKKKKWAGHGHRSGDFTKTAPGELANFCPACPQPGINLPENWKDDRNRWVYRRFFVADGNFKADHVRQKNASDIWLSEGAGMFAERSEYEGFLRTAMERLTVSDLHGAGCAVVRSAGCGNAVVGSAGCGSAVVGSAGCGSAVSCGSAVVGGGCGDFNPCCGGCMVPVVLHRCANASVLILSTLTRYLTEGTM
jgi:hypothetical protein